VAFTKLKVQSFSNKTFFFLVKKNLKKLINLMKFSIYFLYCNLIAAVLTYNDNDNIFAKSKSIDGSNVEKENIFVAAFPFGWKPDGKNKFYGSSVESASESEDFEESEKQIRIKVISYYKTTTITSTRGITITKTTIPRVTHISDKEKFFPASTQTKDSNETLRPTTKNESILPKTNVLHTDKFHIFTNTKTENMALKEDLHITEGRIYETTTMWNSPETWNSYPFMTTEGVFEPIFSLQPHTNSSTRLTTQTSSKLHLSSFDQFKTSTYYGNRTFIESKLYSNSITSRNGTFNSSGISTSQNNGNSNDAYWGSFIGLIFAVCSGIILI
jgi:hypothetical protein